jgi:uncharacterized protein YndB with AHSA1/START domain
LTSNPLAAPAPLSLPPVVKTVVVPASPERAFHRFTAEIGRWWPLGSHSIGQEDALAVTMEPKVGGRIVETIRGKPDCEWGRITVWEPPARIAFTWHPGHEPSEAGEVEVTFAAEGAGTRVRLVHSGFERLGAKAKAARGAYNLGWPWVLGIYAEKRSVFMSVMSGVTAVAVWWQRSKRRRAA